MCKKCCVSPEKEIECVLCPNKNGAFKQTDNGQWSHVICAIWIPEVHFANPLLLEPVVGIDKYNSNWKKKNVFFFLWNKLIELIIF